MPSSDELAVHDLVHAFADVVTRKAVDEMRELFTPDGVWTVPGYGEPVGHDAIIAFLGGVLAHWEGIVHGLLSGRVRLDGDTGTGRWYITEFGIRDGADFAIAGCYTDSYVRRDGRWWFASRRYDGLWRKDPTGSACTPFPAEPAPLPGTIGTAG